MTTPTTREALIALMAIGGCDAECPCSQGGDMMPECADAAARTLAAIEAAGCRVVPAVATAEMVEAIEDSIEWYLDGQNVLNAALAASPFGPPDA